MQQPKRMFLYRLSNSAFLLLMALAVCAAIFWNTEPLYAFQKLWLILAMALGALFFWVVYKGIQRLPSRWGRLEKQALVLFFAAFVGMQLFIGWQLRVHPTEGWDFGLVYLYAKDFVLHGTLPDEYFLLFGNNRGIYALWCGYFSLLRLFGVQSFVWPSILLNIVAIDASLLMLYLCARRMAGRRRALFALAIGACTAPFLLYVPVFYTDTLTLPFPIAAVWLWMVAREKYNSGAFRAALWRVCALSAIVAVGAMLKISVVIVWVALALDALILLKGRRRFWLPLAGAGVLAACFAAYTLLLRALPILPVYNPAGGIPFTHWIMMGLHGNGQYYDPDYQLTLSAPDLAARYTLTLREIGGRLREMGPVGFVRHLLQKLGFTFGDGTYRVADKLDRAAVRPSFLHPFVIFTGARFKLFFYASGGLQGGMLAWCGYGALRSAAKREDSLSFVRVALLGLVLFLLLWETRSRYLVNFLPLFLLCAALAVPAASGHAVVTRLRGKH